MAARVRETDSNSKTPEGATEMKTQIIKTEGLSGNHNQGGLKVKPQIVAGNQINHNQGGLKVKR
jgi:hypothetical protein